MATPSNFELVVQDPATGLNQIVSISSATANAVGDSETYADSHLGGQPLTIVPAAQIHGLGPVWNAVGQYDESALMWSDIIGEVNVRSGGGANAPVVSQYDVAGAYYDYATGTGGGTITQLYFTYHIPHEHKENSDVFIHLHHSKITAAIGTTSWRVDACAAKIGAVFPALVNVGNITHTYTATPRIHTVTELQISNVGGTGSKLLNSDIDIDGLIFVRLLRQQGANGDNLTNNDQVFIHSVDIHHQCVSAIGTLNKTAPFRT